ncbi:hypothetical protein Bateq7PJ16_4259 [Bacillus subtilis]|nr:hypothetical protein BsLM_3942 [Bacillus sp. LM 4-2]NDK01761.1 hypothetical protein [Bacillus subtilis subsp. subtilis]QHF60065.1 hypothetical protein Bateq7PJ16_4259 [Bacillus subtilis]
MKKNQYCHAGIPPTSYQHSNPACFSFIFSFQNINFIIVKIVKKVDFQKVKG